MGKPFSQLFTLFTSDNLSFFVIQKGKQLPLNSQENHSLFLQSNLNSLFGKQLPFFLHFSLEQLVLQHVLSLCFVVSMGLDPPQLMLNYQQH